MNIKKILKAWKNVAITNEEIEAIADQRSAICNKCRNKERMLGIDVCAACHCPLIAKQRSPENSCPLGLWEM